MLYVTYFIQPSRQHDDNDVLHCMVKETSKVKRDTLLSSDHMQDCAGIKPSDAFLLELI